MLGVSQKVILAANMTPFSTDESARISHDYYTGVIILKSIVFGLIKLSFWTPKKTSVMISRKATASVSSNGQNSNSPKNA